MTLIGKKHKPIWTPWLLRRPNVNVALQNVRRTIKPPPATMNEPQITSMSTPRPTPETNAALVDQMPKDATEWSEHYLALCIHSRKLERERDEARALNGDMLKLMRRLHLAITARMSADNPTDEQRLELRLAWEEAASFWKASCL